MALHHLCGPQLPLLEEFAQRLGTIAVTVSPQQLTGRRWRAGAGVQQRDADLARGERAVDEGQIADDAGEKSETETGFSDDESASQGRMRNHVAQAQREKRRAA